MGRLTSDYPSTFVHGDYRLDNLILDPSTYQVRAVLDWEMSTFGDPLMDLALLLAYWEQPADVLRQRVDVARNLTVAPGFWSRDRLLSEYLAATGVPDEHLTACLGLTCLKLATIMEGIHHRHQAGQALDDLSAGLGAMKDILSLMVTHRGYVRVFFEHHRELPPEAKRYVTAQRDAYESLVQSAISAGQARGIFTDDTDTKLITLALFGMCNWAYQWFDRHGRYTADEIAETYWRLVRNGIQPATST